MFVKIGKKDVKIIIIIFDFFFILNYNISIGIKVRGGVFFKKFIRDLKYLYILL